MSGKKNKKAQLKVCLVFGTRPEIIKMASLISALKQLSSLQYFMVHTNQHYSTSMDRVFFDELSLPYPSYHLNVGSGSHGDMVGRTMIKLEKVLFKEKPDIVLVQGDTNSTLAGALVAAKMGISVGHIEAGLRSYDRTMPEEVNRIIVDNVADLLFAPTQIAIDNLKQEGISDQKIYLTGNTIVDVYKKYKENIPPSLGSELYLKGVSYALLTIHRPVNVDNQLRLSTIINAMKRVAKYGISKVIFLVHPRTRKNLDKFNISIPESIMLLDPVGYFAMLDILSHARIVITDSGGIQEEACIMRVPCVTVRDNTERPETVKLQANMLSPCSIPFILKAVKKMINVPREWGIPYGNGNTAIQIIKILQEELGTYL